MGNQKEKPQVTGNLFEDLKNMHDYYGFDRSKVDKAFLMFRLRFLQEELSETILAFNSNDAHSFLDGLIDLIVVAVGTIDLVSADGQCAWERVMNANNSKEMRENPTREGSLGMDLIKPEGWEMPNLYGILGTLPNHLSGDLKYAQVEARPACGILREVIELMERKGQDYNSSIEPMEYYPDGIENIVYMVDTVKRLRQSNLIERIKKGEGINFEGLEDTLKDRIAYLAFGIEIIRGVMKGQIAGRDMFNKAIE